MSEENNISDFINKAKEAFEKGDRLQAKRFVLKAIIGADVVKEKYLTDVSTQDTEQQDQQLADWYGECSVVMEQIDENLTATKCFYTATVFDHNWDIQSHLEVCIVLWTKLLFMKELQEIQMNLKNIVALLSELDKLARLAERRKRWLVCLAVDGDINRTFVYLRNLQIIPPNISEQPGRKVAMLRIARCYLHLNMHQDARRVCSTFLQNQCEYDDPEALEIWARSLFATGNFKIALDKNQLALKYCQFKDGGDRKRLEKFDEDIKKKLEESNVLQTEPDRSWLEGTNVLSQDGPSSRNSIPALPKKKTRHKRPKARDPSQLNLLGAKSEDRRNRSEHSKENDDTRKGTPLERLGSDAFNTIHAKNKAFTNANMYKYSGSAPVHWLESDYSLSDSESEDCNESLEPESSDEDNVSERSNIEEENEETEEGASFYEQSYRFHQKSREYQSCTGTTDTNENLLKFGIKLNMSFMRQFEDRNPHIARKDPFYTEFLSPEKLLEKLRMDPQKYIRCTIDIVGAHEAYCYPLDAHNITDVIEISGRCKIGQCFNEDEVVVELLNNRKSKDKLYGRVLGVLQRQRHKDTEHPVFICTLDDMESHLARPLCRTVPKIHVLNREIWKRYDSEKKRRYKIEIFEYDSQAETLCNPQIYTINPSEARSQVYLVAYINWSIRHIYPRGAVIKKLGVGSNLNAGLMILNLQHSVPALYKQETVEQVQSMGYEDEVPQDLLRGRADFTTLNTFTVDPPGSEDLDDALSLEVTERGYKVGIHIADVSVYIPKDSAVDAEARERATTFYPVFRRPRNMFPEPLSFNRCSLLPGKQRVTISLFFYLTEEGRDLQPTGSTFEIHKAVIRSKRQLTYRLAQDIIVSEPSAADVQLTKDIRTLSKLATKIRKQRLGNSMFSVDWEQSRSDAERETFEAHYLVEEFMIMANRKVASLLLAIPSYKDCVPLRCQPPPSKEHMRDFVQKNGHYIDAVVHLQDRQIGPRRPNFDECMSKNSNRKVMVLRPVWEAIKNSPRSAAKHLLKDELHPLQLAVYQNWISIQEKAGYRCSGCLFEEEDGKHYGLDIFPYTHFTSPIRRYNDLLIHRLVHAAMFNNSPSPYSIKEIDIICKHVNSVAKRAKDYEKDCRSLQQAVELKNSPKTIQCYVDEVSDRGITLCSPFLKYVGKQNRQLTFNLMDMWYKPQVFRDAGTTWDIVKAVWKKRLYNFHSPPIENSAASKDYRLNPLKGVVFLPLWQWARLLKCSVEERFRDLSSATQITHATTHTEMHLHDDVTTECLDTKKIQPNTRFSMTFSRGQPVQIQMTAAPHKGVLVPKPMLYNMTNNVKFCLYHMEDPVLHLYRYVTQPTCDQYRNTSEYLNRWMPLIIMESATGVIRNEESFCINNHPVKFTGINKGKFALGLAECEVRNIELSGAESDDEDEDHDTGHEESYDWLCLKANVSPLSSQQITTNEQMSLESTWIAHASVTMVKKNKRAHPPGKLTVSFQLHEKSPPLPASFYQTQTGQHFSIEILRKTEVDRRTERFIKRLASATDSLAVQIALNKSIPDLESSRVHMAQVTEHDLHYDEFTDDEGKMWNPLPPNNEKQQEAIEKAMISKFSLIQGPPGTGKTYTGIKLIYLFSRVNKMLHSEGKPRKQVLFCGPSNKSVDLVARWMYYRLQPKYRPSIVRVYGRSIEAMDFPIPGKPFYSKRSTQTLQVPSDLYPVALHHIIRQKGKKNAEEITAMDKFFKDHNYENVPEMVKNYVRLIREASIEEIRKHDVILCTTAVGANPRVLEASSVYQVIVDESGMCPEPQCLVPIIATKAEQVVLIGDHKQLRPIIMCKEAALLGLETSLFERYATSQSATNVQFTMLNTQYRMDHQICRFPSRHFYDNKLKTEVSYKCLEIWPSDEMGTYPHVFIHVEGVEEVLTVSTEDGNEQSRSNDAEIKEVAKIFNYFEGEQFGRVQILSQYNAQCSEIRRKLRELNINFNDEKVTTVVSSQGSEWDYVVFSTVRSMPNYMIEKNPTLGWCKHNLGFITDQNQVNVALTRARKGLIIIGNKNLLQCDYTWKRLLNHYEERGCIKTPEEFPPPYRRSRQEKMQANILRSELRYGEHAKYIKGEATSYEGPVDEEKRVARGRRF